MSTIDELRVESDERRLVRKIQKAIGLVAPQSVELPESLLTTGASLVDLKTLGYLPIGMVTPDGWNFGREVETEDVEALGYASAVRTDVVKVERTVGVTTLETGRKHLQEILLGTELDGIKQDPTTGEIVIDEPDLPVNKDLRLLVVGTDGSGEDLWVLGKGFGAATLASTGEEVWGKEGALQRELSFKVAPDTETGSPTRHYMGGPGALKSKTALGYELGEADGSGEG